MSSKYIADVVVVGAGHAGSEAALATARMGKQTIVIVMEKQSIGLMPCNPSIGGPGKGHLVREIDALGGEMGRNVDATAVQLRRLNTGKGPAVQSIRAQADRNAYHRRLRKVLETQPGLQVLQGEVIRLIIGDNGVGGVVLADGSRIEAKAVILSMGTYLNACIHRGEVHYAAGPYDKPVASRLSTHMQELGLSIVRFKTGTPPRARRHTLDYARMEEYAGDSDLSGFSFCETSERLAEESCWLTYTNEATHAIIRANMHRASLYSGAITGPGPRYCPSIEAKLKLFPDRQRHQVFVEPEGCNSDEMYLSGLSTSLPAEVQEEFVHTIVGLEKAEITLYGYAIEYDCLDPLQLEHTLQFKRYPGLYAAGQINGSTGYEEAAAQGLMAGINAVRYLRGEEPIVLRRDEAYIGVLIDDLVTKGTGEPYRILTSRAEYRLLLREGSADRRLTKLGYDIGLVDENRYQQFHQKAKAIEGEKQRLQKVIVKPGPHSAAVLKQMSSQPLHEGVSLSELLRRPEVTYAGLDAVDPQRPLLPEDVVSEVETDLSYAGYITRQERQVAAQRRMEERRISKEIDYEQITGLSKEAREKLQKVKPVSLGQAARIPGVSPADIDRLLMFLEKNRSQWRVHHE